MSEMGQGNPGGMPAVPGAVPGVSRADFPDDGLLFPGDAPVVPAGAGVVEGFLVGAGTGAGVDAGAGDGLGSGDELPDLEVFNLLVETSGPTAMMETLVLDEAGLARVQAGEVELTVEQREAVNQMGRAMSIAAPWWRDLSLDGGARGDPAGAGRCGGAADGSCGEIAGRRSGVRAGGRG